MPLLSTSGAASAKGFGFGASGTPPYPALGGTWDNTKRDPNISLGTGSLVATANNTSYKLVLGTAAASSIVTFNVLFDAANISDAMVGIANSSVNLSAFLGSDAEGYGYAQDGRLLYNGATVATIATWTPAVSMRVDIDVPGQKVRFIVGGGTPTAWYSYTGIAGSVYAAACIYRNTATATYS